MKKFNKNLILVTFVIISLISSAFAFADCGPRELPPEQTPLLIIPENESIINNLFPVLSWSEVPTSEYFEISVSHFDGENLVEIIFKTMQLETQAPEGILNFNINYFWKVRAINGAGYGPWSDVSSFQAINPNVGPDNPINSNKINEKMSVQKVKLLNSKMKINFNLKVLPPEYQPQLILPENEAIINHLFPVLSWSEVPAAEYFEISVSHYDGANLVEVIFKTTQLESLVPEGILNFNINYIWKVRAINSAGYGPWSDVSSFQPINPNVGPDKLINKNEGNNKLSCKEIKLHKNFPNPFNPTTKFNYEIASNSFVKITVYNLLGKEVKTLVNGYQSAGTHSVEFNASSLSSGIYFYRMESNGIVLTNKMNLIK
jgi:hypothetical protein